MQKSLMILNRKPPLAGSSAQEALDAALMAGVFNQQVSLVFLDDGVYQLLKHQDAQLVGRKAIDQTFGLLAMYDIEQLYVELESLLTRNLSPEDLILPAKVIPAHELGPKIAEQDVLLSF